MNINISRILSHYLIQKVTPLIKKHFGGSQKLKRGSFYIDADKPAPGQFWTESERRSVLMVCVPCIILFLVSIVWYKILEYRALSEYMETLGGAPLGSAHEEIRPLKLVADKYPIQHGIALLIGVVMGIACIIFVIGMLSYVYRYFEKLRDQRKRGKTGRQGKVKVPPGYTLIVSLFLALGGFIMIGEYLQKRTFNDLVVSSFLFELLCLVGLIYCMYWHMFYYEDRIEIRSILRPKRVIPISEIIECRIYTDKFLGHLAAVYYGDGKRIRMIDEADNGHRGVYDMFLFLEKKGIPIRIDEKEKG